MLSIKSKDQRLEVLKDNEEELEEQKKKEDDMNNDDDEEEEIDEDTKDDDGDHDVGNLLTKTKKDKNEDDDIESDDDEDSDYEYTGGDLAIYDSALDSIDELLFIKQALEQVNAADASYMATLMSGMTPDELAKFNENMTNAQALKDREEVTRKACDEMYEKKKF